MANLGVPGVEIGEEIGRGGFAVVYKGWQAAFQREVAVKVINVTADVTTQARFEREIAAVGRLSEHGAIVTPLDAGVAPDGRPYLIMPFLSGGSLQDALDGGLRFSWREAAEIGVRLAGALQAAHDTGVLHRDIKPANILLSRYGETLLADFGIARIAGGHQTTSGVVTASLAHAPPEVIEGRSPSPQSDVYGLACTLFTLVAGHPPFVRDGEESMLPLMHRTLTEALPDLGVDASFEAVLHKAMAKDPAQRHASASELANDLERSLAGTPPPRPPPGPFEPAQRAAAAPPPFGPAEPTPGVAATPVVPARDGRPRRRRALVVAALVVVAVVALAAVATVLVLRPDDQEPTLVVGGTTPEGDAGPATATDTFEPPDEADFPLPDHPYADELRKIYFAQIPEGGVDVFEATTPAEVGQVHEAEPGGAVDLELGHGEAAEVVVQVPGGTLLRVVARSDDFDSILTLWSESDELLVADDDEGRGPQGLDALVHLPVIDDRLVRALVGAIADDQTGLGTVFPSVHAPEPLHGPVQGVVTDQEAGVAVYGRILGDNEAFFVTGEADEPVRLLLLGEHGEVIDEAEGSGDVRIGWEFPSAGHYYVIVEPLEPGTEAEFTLTPE